MLKKPTYPFLSSSQSKNFPFSRYSHEQSAVVNFLLLVLAVFFLSQYSQTFIRIDEILNSFKNIYIWFQNVSSCFFLATLGTWDLRFTCPKPFSMNVCLIMKLGDSYLWQLRDSTHKDPPTVEERGKICDISMACCLLHTDMDTISRCHYCNKLKWHMMHNYATMSLKLW